MTVSPRRRQEVIDALRRGSVPRRSLDAFARAVASNLGGRVAVAPRIFLKKLVGDVLGRIGVAPRIFLKKLVGDVLDRIDQFPDFDPRTPYALTVEETELTDAKREARGVGGVDDIDLTL
jgi:hypothetical protein